MDSALGKETRIWLTTSLASYFYLFLGVWIPRWNTRSRFGNSTSKGEWFWKEYCLYSSASPLNNRITKSIEINPKWNLFAPDTVSGQLFKHGSRLYYWFIIVLHRLRKTHHWTLTRSKLQIQLKNFYVIFGPKRELNLELRVRLSTSG